jgi:hypothetical protein
MVFMRKWFLSIVAICLIMPATNVHAVSKELVGKCGHWLGDALEVGWSRSHISKLDYVMWRESRCMPSVFNPTDPNGGSRGLLQINQFWCLPSRYFPNGWLQSQGVLNSCAQLSNPVINLRAALAIFEYSEERNNNGWQPWGK